MRGGYLESAQNSIWHVVSVPYIVAASITVVFTAIIITGSTPTLGM